MGVADAEGGGVRELVPADRQGEGVEGVGECLLPVPARGPHVDFGLAAGRGAGEGAAGGFDAGGAAEIDGQGPAAVAAGGDFAAVGVPEAGFDAGGFARLDEDELVEADAGAAVGEVSHLLGGEGNGVFPGVEQHEIIAQAVHFQELRHG
ncbi:hypothetical protein GCM10007973_14780 [Polymorphobacter multimanifer]|nr:hypothetical protein GCM10007973_14780 [Polymorphobacter multimanifer]